MHRSIAMTALLLLASGIADRKSTFADDENEPSRIANGDRAPVLAVAGWSDETDRTLEDLKGKTVVLHFWGVWCRPCIETIPVWKQLEEKYKEHGVVFVGIHTAGTKMEAVHKFMKAHDWQHLTAIDQGNSTPDSVTFRRYGIPAVNQIVVIDPEGVVKYNGDRPTQTNGPVVIARKLGVKGPGDEGTAEEIRAGGIAILTYMYGKEIEAALKPKPQKQPEPSDE